jgi:hypothetical protein
MRIQTGCVLVGLAMVLSATTTALAQVDAGTATTDSDSGSTLVVADPSPRPALFLSVVDPSEDDVEVPLATTTLGIRGATRGDAVVSVDGNLVDLDEQGGFVAEAQLDEGVNEISIVASDVEGNQVTTTLFVVRGDA